MSDDNVTRLHEVVLDQLFSDGPQFGLGEVLEGVAHEELEAVVVVGIRKDRTLFLTSAHSSAVTHLMCGLAQKRVLESDE